MWHRTLRMSSYWGKYQTSRSGGCFTKTKIDFKLDLTMAGRSCHCFLSPFTGIGLSRDLQIMVTNLQNLHVLIIHY